MTIVWEKRRCETKHHVDAHSRLLTTCFLPTRTLRLVFPNHNNNINDVVFSRRHGVAQSNFTFIPTTTATTSFRNTGQHVNPFHVLQVRQDATVDEIRQHYRRLALWHHPGRRKTMSILPTRFIIS